MLRKSWIYVLTLVLIMAIAVGCTKSSNPTDNIVKKDTQDEILELHVGEISQEISPFFYATKGDKSLLSLMYLKVDASVEDNMEQSPAGEIQVQKAGKKTIYRITLKDGWKDSQGNLLTSDDLLFNYIFRCEIGYRGVDKINQMRIHGLKEFQYGAKGRQCDQMEKQVEKALANPDKLLKKRIKEELIIPVLKKEYLWVESLYEQKEYAKLTMEYSKPWQLFAKYYAADVAYQGKKKTKDAIIEEIAEQYKANYKKLSEITKENYAITARCIAIETLFPNRKSSVKEVAGIQKKGVFAVEITTEGYDKEDINRLADLYLLSRHSEQKIRSGEYFSVGTRGYTGTKENGEWTLQANPYYSHQKPYVAKLQIKE